MTQQDLTAPQDRVKVSRREKFERTYIFASKPTDGEETLRDVSAYAFQADLFNRMSSKVTSLTEGAGISKPDAHTVMLTINTVQMGELIPGEYRVVLSGALAGEREEFVVIVMQVE